MATVSSFEGLPYPSKSELRQFAELFMPLFSASTAEAKREAIAALSQNPNVPSAVAFFIASQPISLSAPFLVSSKALDDETLIAIARTQGAAHARTIVRREDLSPTVVDALVGLRHSRHATGSTHDNLQSSTSPAALTESEARAEREEKLRRQLRTMARQMHRPAGDTLGVRRLTEVQEALLVRFARERDASRFAATLSDSLSASHWLSERILLDISGRQLATTLVGIGMDTDDAIFILECFYPHMRQLVGDISRAESMLESLETAECEERIESWRRADRYTTSSGSDADERREEPTPVHKLVVRR